MQSSHHTDALGEKPTENTYTDYTQSFLIKAYTTIHTHTTIQASPTCHTPTIAFAMRMRRMTKGSTKAVMVPSPSSNQAKV